MTANTEVKGAAVAQRLIFKRPTFKRLAINALASVAAIVMFFAMRALGASDSLLEQAVAEYSSAVETTDRDARIVAFARAEQLFEQAAQEQLNKHGRVNSELFVNLGNAALQAEHIGRAIAAYRQSLEQQPGNQQAIQNLQAARNIVPESFRKSDSFQFVDTLFFWKSQVSRQRLWLWAGLFFLLACVLFATGILRRSSWLRTLTLLPVIAWLVLVASNLLDSNRFDNNAVVQVDEAWLYSADSENSALRLTDPIPDGTELTILENRGRWCEVEVASRTGWLRTSSLLLISADAQRSLSGL